MKKRSRFLQVPVEPFTVDPELKADELLEKMERISFQGRSLGVAHRVWQKMLSDDVTIFMGMAGALSAGGLRMVVAYLIEHRYIDCLVSTGANLYHDLHETRGRHHYLGSAGANDAALAEDRIDRVGHEEHVDRRRPLDPEALAGLHLGRPQEPDAAVPGAARDADAIADGRAARHVLDAHVARAAAHGRIIAARRVAARHKETPRSAPRTEAPPSPPLIADVLLGEATQRG